MDENSAGVLPGKSGKISFGKAGSVNPEDFFIGAAVGIFAGAAVTMPGRARSHGGESFGLSLSGSCANSTAPGAPKKYRVFTVPDGEPLMWRCAWCDDRDEIKVLGRVNHGCCFFHRLENLQSCMPLDHVEILYVALAAKCAGQTWGDDFWRASE